MPSPASGLAGRPPTTVSADIVVAHTLLNCFVREVAEPGGQAGMVDDHLVVGLPRQGLRLRVAVRRVALAGAHRFEGPAQRDAGDGWTDLGWAELAELVATELTLATGVPNPEFAAQVAASHEVTARALRHRAIPAAAQGSPICRYLASEQALALGHRFHPTPKARAGDWAGYAPELGARIRLRHLAVRADRVRQASVSPTDLAVVDRLAGVPEGYLLLPVHPWQFALLHANPALRRAFAERVLVDLGPGDTEFTPTSSVRTLYGVDAFLKFSLNVRITNCVRKNSVYELAASVALTGLLDRRLPGLPLLREPAYRTVDVGDRDLVEGFAVIVREGFDRLLRPGVTPLLAAAIADEYPLSPAHASHLAGEAVLDWWRAYLRLLIPPVLGAFFDHGVVLEPHLQNVVVGVDGAGRPAQVLFRDLEGTKLVDSRHRATLAALPPEVAGPLAYPAERGWQRVAYCLLVNHVSELLATLADHHPDSETELWSLVRDELARFRAQPQVGAVLAGLPVPGKANLLTRWQRGNDRQAGYVPVHLPLGMP